MFAGGRPSWLPAAVPFPRVGAIYQRFTSVEEGIVQNIIQGGDGMFVSPGSGVTFTVNALYQPCGPRTVKLVFKSAQVGDVRITDGLEGFLAPSLLPRGTLQQQLLLAAREVCTITFERMDAMCLARRLQTHCLSNTLKQPSLQDMLQLHPMLHNVNSAFLLASSTAFALHCDTA